MILEQTDNVIFFNFINTYRYFLFFLVSWLVHIHIKVEGVPDFDTVSKPEGGGESFESGVNTRMHELSTWDQVPRNTLLNRLYGEWTHQCWYLFPLEFTLYLHVYGLYCYFWHDCTPVSDSTWCRNIRTLKNIAYPYKQCPWLVLPQYMIWCR